MSYVAVALLAVITWVAARAGSRRLVGALLMMEIVSRGLAVGATDDLLRAATPRLPRAGPLVGALAWPWLHWRWYRAVHAEIARVGAQRKAEYEAEMERIEREELAPRPIRRFRSRRRPRGRALRR